MYAVHKVPPRNARCDDYESEQKSDPSHETAKKMYEEGSQIKRQNDNLLRHFGTAKLRNQSLEWDKRCLSKI